MSKQEVFKESGFLLISVIVMMALTLLVAATLVSLRMSEAKIKVATNLLQEENTLIEGGISKTVSWLDENSKYLVTAFLDSNFNNNFVYSLPTAGANDGAQLPVITTVKIKNSSNSVVLSSEDALGVSSFPVTTHVDTGASLDLVESFQNIDFGKVRARLTLLSVNSIGADKQPVFRLDLLPVGNNAKSSAAYLKTKIKSETYSFPAFFSTTGGINLNTKNNSCHSNQWFFDAGAWSMGGSRSNCYIASDSNILIRSKVDGLIKSKSSISIDGGRVDGEICQQQEDCHNVVLSDFDSWDTTCSASNQGDLVISSNTTLSISSGNCWRDVLIHPNATLTLETTNNQYNFRDITFLNGNTSKIAFINIPEGQQIILAVKEFTSNFVTGENFSNKNNAPHQVRLNVTGEDELDFNGSTDISVDLIAPGSEISLAGNLNFYGAIKAKQINVFDNVTLNADEFLVGVGSAADLSFDIVKFSENLKF